MTAIITVKTGTPLCLPASIRRAYGKFIESTIAVTGATAFTMTTHRGPTQTTDPQVVTEGILQQLQDTSEQADPETIRAAITSKSLVIGAFDDTSTNILTGLTGRVSIHNVWLPDLQRFTVRPSEQHRQNQP